jgi:SAM-dependent methyltransferase
MGQEIENPLFARFFHRFCGRDRGQGERDLRRELLAGATGRVVEVGAGNGINFDHYPGGVVALIAVEPEPYLRRQAEKAAVDAPIPVQVMPGVAASLELPTDSIDVVVVCGVLCSVPDQHEALAEFRRVLRPGGELRFYEHVRSQRPGFARWQRWVDLPWSRAMGGCHTNREGIRWRRGYSDSPERRELGVRRAGGWHRGHDRHSGPHRYESLRLSRLA